MSSDGPARDLKSFEGGPAGNRLGRARVASAAIGSTTPAGNISDTSSELAVRSRRLFAHHTAPFDIRRREARALHTAARACQSKRLTTARRTLRQEDV